MPILTFNVHILPWLILGGLGLVFGIILAVASHFLAVKDTSQEGQLIEALIPKLPGYNCGACGFPGCAGLAEGIIKDGVEVTKCRPLKKEAREEIIAWLKEVLHKDEQK